jgi:predicted transcriptional regulator of viral defense system
MRDHGARDQAVAALAGRQAGVVSHRQLAALGLTASAIDRRIRAGRLHPIHRGVYAVGHRAVGVVGMRWAAVLAVGDGAVVSHATAGAAYDLRRSSSTVIHVTVPGRAGRKRRPGIRVHRPESLLADEVTTLDGLPITTPARTLLDLAAGLRGRPLEAAVAAERRRLLDFADLHELLARYPRRPGSSSLKAVCRATARSTHAAS